MPKNILQRQLRQTCRLVDDLFEHMHHELVVKLPPEPLMIEADPARLAQIVSNLLNNAAKYTPEESGSEWSRNSSGCTAAASRSAATASAAAVSSW